MNFGNNTTIYRSIVFNPQTGDVVSPVNGQIWYNSTTNKFRKREGGVTSDLDTSGTGTTTNPLTPIILSGTKNGVNKTFTLASESDSYLFFLNGALMAATVDYTISGTSLTFSSERPAPKSDDTMTLYGSVSITPLVIDEDLYSFTKSNLESGVYKTVEYFYGGVLRKKSVLSGGTAPEYTTQTITYYDVDGTTVLNTYVFTLAYTSGVLTSKTIV